MTRSRFRLPRAVITTLLLVVTVGLFTFWMAVIADRHLRGDWLLQSRAVTQAVNFDRVRALSGTPADEAMPAFQTLKDQLFAIRRTIPKCRFLYLLGRHADGTIFFFLDSELDTSKDYSPPGQVYSEASAACSRVFDTRAAEVTGPISDRWGVWVTGFVPLTDPQTGKVLAILGMYADVSAWRWTVVGMVALPVGVLLVLIIGVVVIWSSLHRRQRPTRNLLAALGVMTAMLIVTGLITLYAKIDSERDAQQEFDLANNEIRLNVLARLQDCARILISGVALFDASESVEREEWRSFIHSLNVEDQLPGIQGVGFAPWIPRAQLFRGRSQSGEIAPPLRSLTKLWR